MKTRSNDPADRTLGSRRHRTVTFGPVIDPGAQGIRSIALVTSIEPKEYFDPISPTVGEAIVAVIADSQVDHGPSLHDCVEVSVSRIRLARFLVNRCSQHVSQWSGLLLALALAALTTNCGDDSSGPEDSSVPVPDMATSPDQLAPQPTPVPPVPPPPTDAGPSPVDADTGPCDSEGMTRTVPCGRCGLASQTCRGGRWDEPSECLDEQECMAGAIERESLFCGMRSRICDDSCHWRPWSEVSGGGECEPGTTERLTEGCADGLSAERACAEDCRWGEPTDCVATCARAPMPSRTGADVVCVPEGPFVLGTEPYVIEGRTREDALPIRTIVLSDFWIERTPVSKRRLDACFAAGACSEFPAPVWRELYDALPADALAVVEAPLPGAEFCEWDGGRLPSEFQWEKAARGPHPDARRHSWGDDDGDCRHHPGPTCPVGPLFVGDYPLAVSPFGVRFLGVLREHTRSLRPVDEDDDDYAGLDERDPEGYPIPELAYPVDRGFGWTPADGVPPTASIRLPGDGRTGIRCVY